MKPGILVGFVLLVTGCSRACSSESASDPCAKCTKEQRCVASACVALSKTGERCEEDHECAGSGAYCKDAKCALLPKVGQACEEACFESYCGPDKKCRPAAGRGEACGELPCAEDLACLPKQGGTGAKVCLELAAAGAACVRAVPPPKSGARERRDNCRDGYCDAKGNAGVCVAGRKDGEPCGDDYECVSRLCYAASGKCLAKGGGKRLPHPF